MSDPRPFARARDQEAVDGLRHLVDAFRAVTGRLPTQEELDVATERAGLPYRVSLDEMRRVFA